MKIYIIISLALFMGAEAVSALECPSGKWDKNRINLFIKNLDKGAQIGDQVKFRWENTDWFMPIDDYDKVSFGLSAGEEYEDFFLNRDEMVNGKRHCSYRAIVLRPQGKGKKDFIFRFAS